jgi:hypothetical protein
MVDRMMMVQHRLYGTETLRRGGQARTKDYAQPSLVYRDNQDAMSASIRMRLRGWILG